MEKTIEIKIRMVEKEQSGEEGTYSYTTTVDVPENLDMIACIKAMQKFWSKALDKEVVFE